MAVTGPGCVCPIPCFWEANEGETDRQTDRHSHSHTHCSSEQNTPGTALCHDTRLGSGSGAARVKSQARPQRERSGARGRVGLEAPPPVQGPLRIWVKNRAPRPSVLSGDGPSPLPFPSPRRGRGAQGRRLAAQTPSGSGEGLGQVWPSAPGGGEELS